MVILDAHVLASVPLDRPCGIAIAGLFVVLAMAGCMGEVPVPPDPGPEDPPEDAAVEADANTSAFPMKERLRPWVTDLGPVYHEPGTGRVAQFEYEETGFGAVRLMSDGQAFFFIIDARFADPSLPADVLALARVYDADYDHTIARGAARALPGQQSVVTVPSHEMVRMGNDYAFELVLLVPADPALAADDEALLKAAHASAGLSGENATLIHEWSGPLSFAPTWSLGFDGPTEGRDRTDLLEDDLLGGPDVGTYTMTITGERIWVADIAMAFGDSRVVGTEPQAYSNGSSSVGFQLEGAQPLEVFLDKLPDQGLGQSFKMVVQIDFQSGEELPAEEMQHFTLKTDVGYRLGGNTYVAGSSGKMIEVRVEKRL